MLGNLDIDKLIDRFCERLERGGTNQIYIAIHHFDGGADAYPYRTRPTLEQAVNDTEDYDPADPHDRIEIIGPRWIES